MQEEDERNMRAFWKGNQNRTRAERRGPYGEMTIVKVLLMSAPPIHRLAQASSAAAPMSVQHMTVPLYILLSKQATSTEVNLMNEEGMQRRKKSKEVTEQLKARQYLHKEGG